MKLNDIVVRGADSGKDGGGSSGATEASDTLRSKQFASFIDVLCEGPIVGLVNGAKSIFLNNTPLQNDDGSFNFNNVVAQWRTGEQNQTSLDGFYDVQSETGVSVQVKQATPVIRTINDPNIDAVRVTVSVPRLTKTDNTNGNIDGSLVTYTVEVQSNNGGYVNMLTDSIKGKTASRYQRAHVIQLPGDGPWDIRVTRVTPDAPDSFTNNDLYFDSFTQITYARLSYPNSALVGLRIDSEQFDSIPTRGYGIRAMIVKIPSNYNPETRTYTGIWDGTFKLGWTDNPAWCFYDLLISPRYGTGNYVNEDNLDKWSLYEIAQYCDQLVDDGYGGMEPRFTCNLYLQTREQAYQVIQNFASIFRAITFWGAGKLIALQDRESNTVSQQFNNANVVDGRFEYSGTAASSRHTVALVAWNDPLNFYQQRIEYVQDDEGVRELGIIKTNVTAFGCASRGQARRLGKWMLATERMLDDSVAFTAGIDTLECFPGAIIQTSDYHRAGNRPGGRIVTATETVITLDAPTTIIDGFVHSIQLTMPDGSILSRQIVDGPGDTSTVTLAQPLTELPLPNSLYIVTSDAQEPDTWRVVSVQESERPASVDIVALKHFSQLFAFVEEDITFTPPNTSVLDTIPPTPTNLAMLLSRYTLEGDMVGVRGTLSWTGSAPRYRVRWRKENGTWNTRTQFEPTMDFDSLDYAMYEFSVSAVSLAGRESSQVTLLVEALPEPIPLPDITGLVLEGPFTTSSARFSWNACPGAISYETRIRVTDTLATVHAVNVGNTTRFAYSADDMVADGGPWRNITFEVKAIGRYGSESAWKSIAVENPQIGVMNGLSVTAGIRTIFVKVDRPTDSDFGGVLVWVGTEPDFVTGAETLVYDGPQTYIVINRLADGSLIDPETDYYVRLAGYDNFGKDELTISGSLTIQVVSSAPDANSITADMIKDGALELTKFASGLQPVGLVDGLPDPTGYDGPTLVSDSVTGKLWKLEGGAWVSAAPATVDPGSIDESAFTSSLNDRIDLIDAGPEVAGSVAHQVAQEAIARGEAIGAVQEEVDYNVSMTDIAVAAAKVAMSTQTTSSSAMTARVSSIAVSLGETINAKITEEQQVRAEQDLALAQQITTLTASVGDNSAAIQQESQARVDGDNSLAQTISTLSSTVGNHTVAIQQTAEAVDGVAGRVEVKIDNNGYISGYALESTTGPTGEPDSKMKFKVDDFLVGGTGVNAAPVFSIDTREGQEQVVIDGVIIKDGTIVTRAISAGAVTTTELAAGAVTADKLYVGGKGAALSTDPTLSAPNAWNADNVSFIDISDAPTGTRVARSIDSLSGYIEDKQAIPIDLTKAYRISLQVRKSATANGSLVLGVKCFDANGLPVNDGVNPVWEFAHIAAENIADGFSFISSTMNTVVTELFATNCKTMKLYAGLNIGGTAGYMEVGSVKIESTVGGTLIEDGSISTQQLAAGAVTSDKLVANVITADKIAVGAVTADKIGTGTLTAGTAIFVGTTDGGDPALELNGNGEVISRGDNGDKARLYYGNVEIYKDVPDVGEVVYKALSRLEIGFGTSNVPTTIPGYFKTAPKIMVSPLNVQLYDPDYSSQKQTLNCEAINIVETSPGSMVWRFTPVATLTLSANTGTVVTNESTGLYHSDNWTSAQYTTDPNCNKITPSFYIFTQRGDGGTLFFNRTVRWRVEYLSGGTWVNGNWFTYVFYPEGTSVSGSEEFTFPSSDSWTFRIRFEAYDTDGSKYGSVSYEYGTDTVSRSDPASFSALNTSGIGTANTTVTTIADYVVPYSPPSGWEVTGVTWTYSYSYYLNAQPTGSRAQINGADLTVTTLGKPTNSAGDPSLSANYSSTFNMNTFESDALSATLRAIRGTSVLEPTVSAYLTYKSATATITRRRAATNSTTPNNTFTFSKFNYQLTDAAVLSEGTLNYMAIGD